MQLKNIHKFNPFRFLKMNSKSLFRLVLKPSRIFGSRQGSNLIAGGSIQRLQGLEFQFKVESRCRSFHTSNIVLAKAKKGGSSGKKGGNSDDDDAGPSLPDLTVTKKNMESVVERLSRELGKLKVGRASADMFNELQVGSYGSVSSAGQVTVKSSNTVCIAVYDPTMVKTVADAIKDCGQGFNPVIENSNVSVFIPKPSKESRDAVIKTASRVAEKVIVQTHYILM